jgi:SulP family sulfate permease
MLFNRLEFAGSLGDLGTILPLGIAMIVVNGLHAHSVMVMIGLVYILAGSYFRVPISVEPMKVIGAVSIAMGLSPVQITSAALWMGVFTLILGATGLIHWIGRHTPQCTIRGVQLAGGVALMVKAVDFIVKKDPNLPAVEMGGVHVGLVLGIAGILATFLLLNNRKVPAALLVVGGGMVVGLLIGKPFRLEDLTPGFHLPWIFPYGTPTWDDILFVIPVLVIPQIPMTIGNAIFSSSDMLRKYYDQQAGRATYGAVANSQGLADIASFFIGGLPMCHGAGGIACHYVFGARTNGSNLMIGAIFIALGLFFGQNALTILNLLPRSILGVLLLFAGAQLALMIADLKERKDLFVALVMLVISLAANLGVAFLCGIVLANALKSDRMHI